MNELYGIYLEYFNDDLILAVAGNPVSQGDGLPVKLKIKPVSIKNTLMFQVTRTVGTKELHENLDAAGAAKLLAASADSAEESVTQHFRQIEIKTNKLNAVTLISKKGKYTHKEHKAATKQVERDIAGGTTGTAGGLKGFKIAADTENLHNRRKNYVLEEGIPVPFLVELGVMTPEGRVVKARYDKFRQINRYLEFVEDVIPSLPKDREISIIDFGCGKSYLTFALYYYLHEVKGLPVRITGLDLKADVIANCNGLAKRFGYTGLEFLHGDIADYTGTDSVDMVVTLHACDTATDYALYKAVRWGAKVIFCVPCCQHELNRQLKDERQQAVLKYGLIKERMAALYTDAIRADILEEQGYKTQILEFIDMEHTPKNILIRAIKAPHKMLPGSTREQSYEKLMEELNVSPTLYRLLKEEQ